MTKDDRYSCTFPGCIAGKVPAERAGGQRGDAAKECPKCSKAGVPERASDAITEIEKPVLKVVPKSPICPNCKENQLEKRWGLCTMCAFGMLVDDLEGFCKRMSNSLDAVKTTEKTYPPRGGCNHADAQGRVGEVHWWESNRDGEGMRCVRCKATWPKR